MIDDRKLCFVVMGFGKKTDFATGRLLDLDATYEAIIKPAVEGLGIRCVRADEVLHSGVIDTEMYEMLLRADIVIADISTGNVNAVYELGVRHALRPNSTVIIKEVEGNQHFDLDHVNTFEYTHMGEDIGVREAKRAVKELCELIEAALTPDRPDSPVYTFLPTLQQPSLTDEKFEELVDEVEAEQQYLSQIMRRAEAAQKESRHTDAAEAYIEAKALKPNDPYIIQQLALATYKSECPSVLVALENGLKIISLLRIEASNDPETQGIAGAIRKRLWLETEEVDHLDAAIRHYRRGYEFKRDYYNGENLATCYSFRSQIQLDKDEALFDRMSAYKVRQSIIKVLTQEMGLASFGERTDRKWVYGTLANCYYALGKTTEGKQFESEFRKQNLADWELGTFELGKRQLMVAT